MTTATAFGSLWLSNHPGTSSMGKLMALSLVCTMAAAVLFQPVLMGPAAAAGGVGMNVRARRYLARGTCSDLAGGAGGGVSSLVRVQSSPPHRKPRKQPSIRSTSSLLSQMCDV